LSSRRREVSIVLVAKVGGSLFDLADLGPRLRGWLAQQPEREVLLVPGGGAGADVVRSLDRLHDLSEETSHWLAVRVLSVNAHFLAALVPGVPVITGPDEAGAAYRTGRTAVLDAWPFCRRDEALGPKLPHTWQATSDSIAARAALVFGARRLVLLKSTDVPVGLDWDEAARRGLVDGAFASALHGASRLKVEAVNLRGHGPSAAS
jgi:aspartokinase-like uncharacterized kinase